MAIKQMSIFLENKLGSFSQALTVLGDNQIDLIALSVADTTDFGIMRTIVCDLDRALSVVKENGYTAKCSDVIAVGVSDTPGGLAAALQVLHENNISIEYMYSFVRRIQKQAVIILRVPELEKTESILAANGYNLLTMDEIDSTC